MVTQKNFTDHLPGLKPAKFGEALKMLHDFVMESTEMGTNWAAYQEPEVKPMVDEYFEKLNAFLNTDASRTEKETKPKQETEKMEKQKSNNSKQKIDRRSVTNLVRRSRPAVSEELDFELTERIPEEIRFIRRYVLLHNKKKTRMDFLRLINALHRAMAEKRIRKSSQYAKQILYIQDKLIKTYNTMKKVAVMLIPDKIIAEFKELIASEKVYPTIMLLKRYVSLNGKYGVKDKAKILLEAMNRAFEKGRVAKNDKYYRVYDLMHNNLSKYIKNKTQKILTILEPELSGLNGVIGEESSTQANVSDLSGIEGNEVGSGLNAELAELQVGVMSSMDFKQLQFQTIGFTGKYKDFIGDPSPGFTAMVFGKPKMGKSILCIDFAGYLARNHGKVLYVAKEEGLDYTLQEKLKTNDVAHHNLDIAETIPEALTDYQFVFLDSVNSLGLSNADLIALKEHNPGISFIQIFQTTKAGQHRGDNESQHNVDVVIEVPEKGVAVQNGRFNQGGTLRIFGEDNFKEAA